jgi:hypothetical protein
MVDSLELMPYNYVMSKHTDTDTKYTGEGLESIAGNGIEVTMGMKVSYFDMANQNGNIRIVTGIEVTDWHTQYVLFDTVTGETSTNSLRGYGWGIVR